MPKNRTSDTYQAGENTRFYLGEPVEIVEEHGDGWTSARWPDGKVYRHWADQLELTPWGRPADTADQATPTENTDTASSAAENDTPDLMAELLASLQKARAGA